MSLGSNISRLRKEAGLTQEALAKKLDVTNQAVSKWETDQCCPDTLLLPKIADVLETSIDALFGRALVVAWEDRERFRLLSYDSETEKTSDFDGNDMLFSYNGTPPVDVSDLLSAIFSKNDKNEQ